MQETVKKTITAPSRSVTRWVPAEWGRSELTRFLNLAEEQAHASFAGLPEWILPLEAVDKALTQQAPTFFHEIDPPRQVASNLFLRSFGTFRAACRLTLSGQAFETTVLTRSVLESAIYAWACGHSEAHREAWKHRSDGDSERKICKKLFGWSALVDELAKVNSALANRINTLYGQVIEHGAHPNIDGVLLSSETNQVAENRFEVSTIFIHGEDGILTTTLDLLNAMDLVYELLYLTISDRLKLLGIDLQMDAERKQLLAAIHAFEQREESKSA